MLDGSVVSCPMCYRIPFRYRYQQYNLIEAWYNIINDLQRFSDAFVLLQRALSY
jgi:hypothetical protein